MKRKYILMAALVAIIGIIVLRLVSNKQVLDQKNTPKQDTLVSIPVKIATAEEKKLEINLLKTGSIAAFKQAKVQAPISGNIAQLRFSLGTQVSEGQVIAVMDNRALKLDLQKAETAAAKLKQDLQTYTELLQGNAATQDKVNGIRQDYLDAVNQVGLAKKQLADAYIKAPTSGTIAEKPVEEGVYVAAGGDIGTIVNLSKAKVKLNLTETEVYQVKPGQLVKVTTDVYPGRTFSGQISFISPQADETHNYQVEIMAENHKNAELRSGTFVYADFSRKTRQDVLLIPREALTGSIKDAAVYVVKDHRVRLRPIRTGSEMGRMIQVSSGLKAGEQVVTSGQINLKDGTVVSNSK